MQNFYREHPPVNNGKVVCISLKSHNHTFSEEEILSWQDELFCNGFHSIEADTMEQGRNFLQFFLPSLSYYQQIAFLSLEKVPMMPRIVDILQYLQDHDSLKLPGGLYNFFLDWHYDFLWVEGQKELALTTWFPSFIELLQEFDINQTMPIFTVLYPDA